MALTLCGVWNAAVALAQTPEREPFAEQARVTAIDLVIDARRISGAPADRLDPASLTVREDGAELPVVGVSALGVGEGKEPWRLVVYFDLTLSSTATVRAVSQTLAAQAATLVSLGTVEIWVADPAPRLELTATRDTVLIEEALSRLFVEAKGRARLREARRWVLKERADADREGGGRRDRQAEATIRRQVEQMARAVRSAGEEALQVRRSLDTLLTWAMSTNGTGPHALLWVGDGYDLDPGLFYQRRLAGVSQVGNGPSALAAATKSAGTALGALGWVAVPLAYDSYAEAVWFQDSQYDRVRRWLQQDPNEVNGAALIKVPIDKLLGRTPKQTEEPALLAPVEPLKALEQATAGEIVTNADDLPTALRRLGERFRVTYQVSRMPDGKLRSVTVDSSRAGLRLRAPARVHSATPEAVTEARVRRILDGETDSGELLVDARYRATDAEGAARGVLTTQVRLTPRSSQAPDPAPVPVRLTVAYADRSPGEGGGATFEHELLEGQDWQGEFWRREQVIEPPAGAQWVVVVVEDLSSGAWGSWEVEVGPPPEEDDEGL
jgi:hypothetical protein